MTNEERDGQDEWNIFDGFSSIHLFSTAHFSASHFILQAITSSYIEAARNRNLLSTVYIPDGMPIAPAVFEGLAVVTDRHTDHATSSAAICKFHAANAMRLSGTKSRKIGRSLGRRILK